MIGPLANLSKNMAAKSRKRILTFFQFQTRKCTSQACKYLWKHWKWVLRSLASYLNKAFHSISSLLQFGSWKWNVEKPLLQRLLLLVEESFIPWLWKLPWYPRLARNANGTCSKARSSCNLSEASYDWFVKPSSERMMLNCIQVSQYSTAAGDDLILNPRYS